MDERRVLIVEDHAETAETLRRILAREGWKTSVATTLAGGLASLNVPPDCVILDVLLPDGSGTDLLREVRERELTTRVIVTTAAGDSDDLEALSRFVPDVILFKPYSFKELRRALEPLPSVDPATVLIRNSTVSHVR
jgi:DNA-binding response OmpR family regulator